MKLIRLVFGYAPWSVAGVLLMSIASAFLSIGVIAFVNRAMLAADTVASSTLWAFAGLLVLLLVFAAGSHVALTTLGHSFVYQLRCELVKRVLDTDVERLEAIGGPNIVASLSDDLRKITQAFVSLPQFFYGLMLSLASFCYLAWLSLPLFATVTAWMSFVLVVGWLLVTRLHHHLQALRESVDLVYQDYQAVIDGRKELALNRDRARRQYYEEFDASASLYRKHVILADCFHGVAVNWANIMVLGTIGLAFYLANGLGWAPVSVAATYAMTILFLRSPLLAAVSALPSQMAAGVALKKVESLALAGYEPGFHPPARSYRGRWQCLELRGVRYSYPGDDEEPGFDVGPIDLSLNRGEIVFLIGGNGSGKTTLARIMTGLYQPQAGDVRLDGQVIAPETRSAYRQLFATVFTDFHLFPQLLGEDGMAADSEGVAYWLDRLGIRRKVRMADGRLLDTQLSQGQRKRLALMLALLEQRDVLLLDEWAADQDPQFRRVFYRELLPLLKAQGKTVVAITHDDYYFDQADRLLKMDTGELVELHGEQRERASVDALYEITHRSDRRASSGGSG